MKPLLSIVTVTYNSDKTLKKCVKSITSQKQEGAEYIVIDGKSSDDTLKILDDFKAGIDKMISEKDTGIYNAMNKGIHASSGKFVLFINSDDELCPGAIQNVLNSIQILSDEKILAAPVYVTDGKTKNFLAPKLKIGTTAYYTMPTCHQGLVMERELLLKYGGLDESYRILADFDLLLKCLEDRIPYRVLDEAIAVYTLGGAGAGIKHLKEYSRVYRVHNFPRLKSLTYVAYIWLSYHLQKKLPPSWVKIIQKIKKSPYQQMKF